jgi:hypothetical protein
VQRLTVFESRVFTEATPSSDDGLAKNYSSFSLDVASANEQALMHISRQEFIISWCPLLSVACLPLHCLLLGPIHAQAAGSGGRQPARPTDAHVVAAAAVSNKTGFIVGLQKGKREIERLCNCQTLCKTTATRKLVAWFNNMQFVPCMEFKRFFSNNESCKVYMRQQN